MSTAQRHAVLLHKPATEIVSLALYDSMCRSIDAAYEVDEVKDIRDKALAFEVYARQAQNVEAERRACEIRLRSERKAGELLKVITRAKAEHGRPQKASDAVTLSELGVSRNQSSQWQKLADVPDDQFEAALSDYIHKPSTAGIIAAAAPPKPEIVPVAAEALWLWGRLKDFERDGLLGRSPTDVLLTMTPTMLDEAHRLAPRVAKWLAQIGRTS